MEHVAIDAVQDEKHHVCCVSYSPSLSCVTFRVCIVSCVAYVGSKEVERHSDRVEHLQMCHVLYVIVRYI